MKTYEKGYTNKNIKQLMKKFQERKQQPKRQTRIKKKL